mmetsp:Transcript_84475/g.273559  ORF Transcript_84475/g.273559 Transcript_84475/m.273559 type:complete len:246 (-) Transcript_84475:132-869(-)
MDLRWRIQSLFGPKRAQFSGPSATRSSRTVSTTARSEPGMLLPAGSSSSPWKEAVTTCSSWRACRKASTEKMDLEASSPPSTSSSMMAALRTRSMTSSRFRSSGRSTSKDREKFANWLRASCISGRAAPRRPRATAEAPGPMACTKRYFVRRRRPSPKPMRRKPNITASWCAARHSRMPSTEPSPPATMTRALGSGSRKTQFQAPSGSAMALRASRPTAKLRTLWRPGMRLPEPTGRPPEDPFRP